MRPTFGLRLPCEDAADERFFGARVSLAVGGVGGGERLLIETCRLEYVRDQPVRLRKPQDDYDR